MGPVAAAAITGLDALDAFLASAKATSPSLSPRPVLIVGPSTLLTRPINSVSMPFASKRRDGSRRWAQKIVFLRPCLTQIASALLGNIGVIADAQAAMRCASSIGS